MNRLPALLLVLVVACEVRAEDWPGWLGPRRDGSSSEKIGPWKDKLTIVWKQPVGEGHGSPVVVGDRVYLHTKNRDKMEEVLQAFDVAKGTQLWEQSYPRAPGQIDFGNGPRATPMVVNGKVYTMGITGLLTCFDAQKGDRIWQVDTVKDYKAPKLRFGISCSPLVEEGKVFVNVGAKGAGIVAFDKDTGKEAWKALDDPASYSSPIARGTGSDRSIIFLTGAGLVAVAPADGKAIWQFPYNDIIAESSITPVVADDLIVGSTITRGCVAIRIKNNTPEQVWNVAGLTCYFSTPVPVGKEHLYLVTGTNPLALAVLKKTEATLRCIETATGKELWKKDKVGTYHASLTRMGDNKLLLLEEPGNLVLVEPDAKEYRELARSKICGNTWAHPALADGKLYIRDAKELVCVQLP